MKDINPHASVTVLLDFLRPTNVDSIIATNVPAEALLPAASLTTLGMVDSDDNERADNNNNKDTEDKEEDEEGDETPYTLTGLPSSQTPSQRSLLTRSLDCDGLVIVSNRPTNQQAGPPPFDFVVDAADGVTDKVLPPNPYILPHSSTLRHRQAYIIDACVRSGTPVVVSGGVGGLIDPTMLCISDITMAVGDKLIMQVTR